MAQHSSAEIAHLQVIISPNRNRTTSPNFANAITRASTTVWQCRYVHCFFCVQRQYSPVRGKVSFTLTTIWGRKSFVFEQSAYYIQRNETKLNRTKPHQTKTILQLNLEIANRLKWQIRSVEIANSLFLIVRMDVNNQ